MKKKSWLKEESPEAQGELDKVICSILGINTPPPDTFVIPVEKRGELAKAVGVNPGCLSQEPTIRSLLNGVKKAVKADRKWWKRQTPGGIPLESCGASA